jgi:hypothetical protein
MSRHSHRIEGIVLALEKSLADFSRTLEALEEEAAVRTPAAGGWSPAQIGWHVGVTNEMLSAILTGELPRAEIAPEDFQEQPWDSMTIPDRIQTFPQLEPPADVDLKTAVNKLAGSAATLIESLRTVSHERARHYIVKMSFGTLSLYQVGEFAAAHIDRHHRQLQRALSPATV